MTVMRKLKLIVSTFPKSSVFIVSQPFSLVFDLLVCTDVCIVSSLNIFDSVQDRLL